MKKTNNTLNNLKRNLQNGKDGLPFIVHYVGDYKFKIDRGLVFDGGNNRQIMPKIDVSGTKTDLKEKWDLSAPTLTTDISHTFIYLEVKTETIGDEDVVTAEIKSAASLPLQTVNLVILKIATVEYITQTIEGQEVELARIKQFVSSNILVYPFKKQERIFTYGLTGDSVSNTLTQTYFTAFCKASPNNTFLEQVYYTYVGSHVDEEDNIIDDWEAIYYTIVDNEIVASDPVEMGTPTGITEPFCNAGGSSFYTFSSPILYSETPLPSGDDGLIEGITVGAYSYWFNFTRVKTSSTNNICTVSLYLEQDYYKPIWPQKVKLTIYKVIYSYLNATFTLESCDLMEIEQDVTSTDIENRYVEIPLPDLEVTDVSAPPSLGQSRTRIGGYGDSVNEDGTGNFNTAFATYVGYQEG